ncbi:MAG: hypothetical protein AB7I19_12170 [Planctomycetota bacterium]
MRRNVHVVIVALAFGALLCAQSKNEREATVGMRARIDQVVLPGSKLVARPADDPKAPILLRIVETWPHGTDFRYDLEWVGYAAGRHDLSQWLIREDGSPVGELPAISVLVKSVLNPFSIEPDDPTPRDAPKVGGYRTWQVVAGVLWLIGLVAILFYGRRAKATTEQAALRPLTLADRLRPLVESAMRGELGDSDRAALERLLVAHWRSRLGLGDAKAALAIESLRAHPQAGELLRALEEWLHRPTAARTIDVQSLLAPYRDVPDPDEVAKP